MHSFFTNPATHIGPEGQLHLWAMAKQGMRNAAAPFAAVCEPFDCLGLQPPEAMHATVLRLAPADGDVAAFCTAFRRECVGIGELHIPIEWPLSTDDSVICLGTKSSQWDRLIGAAQRASACAFGDDAVAYDPPFGPHVTIAYGVSDGSNEAITAALRDVRDALPNGTDRYMHELEIDSVVLARVFQDREAGTYTCDILAEVIWGK